MRNVSQAASPPVDRLLEDYAANPTPEIREKLVEAHLYIAEIIARKFSGRGVDYDDLYQVAALALFKAAGRFDPSRGIKFASFVTPSMVGEVRNYFRDKARAIRMPRRGVEMMCDIEHAKETLIQKLGRMPRSDELAEALNVSEDMVLEALEIGSFGMVSLDAVPEDGDNAPSLEAFLGMEDPEYAQIERSDAVRRAMSALSERQNNILRMRYFEEMSQRDIAERLHLSQMTISREERKALEILKRNAWHGLDQ